MAWSVTGNIRGPKGDTGSTGATPTVSAGTTTTGGAGSEASVTNSGTSTAAVFEFTIPRGDTGIQGPTGSAGIQGEPGVSLDIEGTVATYADLLDLDGVADGQAWVVAADGKLYIYFEGWPADGEGVSFVGPQGPTGAAGSAGSDGATGASGGVGATGATGSTGDPGVRGSLWYTGTGVPSGISGVLVNDQFLDTASGDVYTYYA